MRCIYCLRDSTKSRSIPHCLPEALLRNGPALPLGAICDACNHYAGANLEAILVEHPAIALPLQLLGVPGKKGKPRSKLGAFERGIEEDAAVTLAVRKPEMSLGPDGVTRAKFQIGLDPGFNMTRFRRALYHAAFNLAVFNRGLAWAFLPQYDPLRRYVRQPRRGEKWTFVTGRNKVYNTRTPVSANPILFEGADLVRLRFYETDFLVDLLNTGCLDTTRITPIGAGEVVGPHWQPRASSNADPNRRYRVSILKGKDES